VQDYGACLQFWAGRCCASTATFTFLGFTHFLAKDRRGILNIVLKPSIKARERFISKVRTWLKVTGTSLWLPSKRTWRRCSTASTNTSDCGCVSWR
jgi:hypothetical protein